MRLLVFSWPYALFFWLVYLWAFAPEFAMIQRSTAPAAASGSKDSGSLRFIVLGMWLGLLISFPIAFVKALRFPAAWNLAAFFIGTGLLVAGSLLRRHCWRMLGAHFTGDVRAREDQPVIDRGAYRWVRHPSYTGGILMFAGIGVALSNWASLAILVVVSVAVYSYRIAVEEKALLSAIGEPYAAFMRSRKRFIPYVI
ncbi:MAG TPA: isoprenylcysteine carboxylmethyltransferase family protein [Thermoanaerobaculia bacterium]|nr:isoprenylcysteine carboxylmethyltransferase family protein [Thermoanaerobaculia bacterium]